CPSRRRHTRFSRDWSSDVCSSDLPVTIADNETKQVEFVTAAGVPATTYYVYNGTPGFYGYYSPITDQSYGMSGITDVQNWLEFSDRKSVVEGESGALGVGRARGSE